MADERRFSNEIKSMFDKKGRIVLISAILLTFIYWILALWYTNKSGYTKDLVVFYAIFGTAFHYHPMLDFWQYIYQFWMTMFLFFLIPLIIIKYSFKEDFHDYGVRAGKKKKLAISLTILFSILAFFVSIFISQQSFMISEYPLTKIIGTSWALFIVYEFMYFFYFFAYEWMMRGYIQWGLKREDTTGKGIFFILVIQTTITVFFHIGKSYEEMLSVVVFGFVLGYVALKFDSIWYGMTIHFLLNVFSDFFILLRLGMLPTHI